MDEHNPYYVHIRGGKPIKLWTNKLTSPHPAHVEPEALQQLENVSRLPFIFKHVAAMPDCHWGMGATIGSVIATKGAIIPAAVGVDIGCGMMAVQTTLKAKDLPYTLAGLRSDLERAIPVGGPGVTGSWSEAGRYGPPASVSNRWRTLSDRWKVIAEKYPVLEKGATVEQLGTLGTGNHFIEVCLDEDQSVWVMLHSGSRGLGGRVGKFFIDKAKGEMKKWYIHLEDTNLSYLTEGSEYFNDYVQAVDFAQEFAAENRQAMMERALGVMHKILPPFQRTKMAVNCHHNYVARENFEQDWETLASFLDLWAIVALSSVEWENRIAFSHAVMALEEECPELKPKKRSRSKTTKKQRKASNAVKTLKSSMKRRGRTSRSKK